MTGFGAASRVWGGQRIDVEARSVNGRFFDARIRQPYGPRVEHALRVALERRIGRGRVDLSIALHRAPPAAGDAGADETGVLALGLDRERLDHAIAALDEVARAAARAGLEVRPPTTAEVLRFLVASRTALETVPEPPDFLGALVEQALDALCSFREREGEALGGAIATEIDGLEAAVRSLAAELPAERDRTLVRLRERLETLWPALAGQLAAHTALPAIDPDRIAAEAALLIVRAEVTEELARTASHVEQLREVLAAAPSAGQGRTLEFVIQEILREVTTIGSKIVGRGPSRTVIEMKGFVERIREQVQNVE
jgi:uncharacterized protein (TIGR00255 family)